MNQRCMGVLEAWRPRGFTRAMTPYTPAAEAGVHCRPRYMSVLSTGMLALRLLSLAGACPLMPAGEGSGLVEHDGAI